MAYTNLNSKPGLTTFGWLAIGATAFALLRKPENRAKLKDAAKGFTDKFGAKDPAATTTAA